MAGCCITMRQLRELSNVEFRGFISTNKHFITGENRALIV